MRWWAPALAAALLTGAGGPAAPTPPPRLVVLLVVDQMRADYLERYGGRLTGGLARLMAEGAWFTQAAYPYLNTVTCAGHATIGTGTFPYQHGMILNAWYDRATGTSPTCTADPSATEISYSGLTPGEGDSAARLARPAIGEHMRARARGRVVTLSLKPRSSVPLAGRQADVVVWFDDRGGWVTSSVYGAPSEAVRRFVQANPPGADYDKVWDRMLPADAYQHEDDAPGERPAGGWTRSFPHRLGSSEGRPDAGFYGRWQRSPYSDEYLERMAAAIVRELSLGRGAGTDVLGISFSALDLVGHAFGPRSHEVQDVLFRLDAAIGRVLDTLDREVGRGNYVLGLSSDHGVAEIPEQVSDSGRLLGPAVSAALQKTLAAAHIPGPHVASVVYTDIYFVPGVADRLTRDRKLRGLVLDTLRSLPGAAAAFHGSELTGRSARTSSDPARRAAALSYYPGRSGDMIIVPRERWILAGSATTHGTLHSYDQRVPVMLYGRGVTPGRRATAATPADIAPTLAAVAGVRMENTDGRVLREALAAGVVK